MPSSGCGRTGFKDGQLVKPGLGRPGYGGLDWDEGGDRPMDTPSGRGSGHEAATQHDSGGGGDGPHRGDVGGPAPTVTTGGGGPHRGDVGGPAPTVTTGGRRTYKAPPFITTGGNRQFTPFINPKGRRTITGGITGSNRFQKFISKIDPRKWNIDDSDETGGNLLQMIANMPKYWDLPEGLTSLIKAGKDIPFAHGFKTKEALEAAKKFGFETSRFKKIPTLSEIEKAIKTKSLKALGQAEGVFGATGETIQDALAKGAQYAKGAVTRGAGAYGPTSQVLRGMVNPALGYVDRGMLGNVQVRLPSGVVNKAFDLGSPGGQRVLSGTGLDHLTAADAKASLTKTGGIKNLGVVDTVSSSGRPQSLVLAPKALRQSATNKLLSRLLPGANVVLGGASAMGHVRAGDYGQAAMAALSMAPGPLGYAGLAGEMGLGALQNVPSMEEQGMGSYTGPMIGRNYNRGGIVSLYG